MPCTASTLMSAYTAQTMWCHACRAVGWYLLADRDRVSMDCNQWKTHCDEVEAALTHERAAWNKKQDEIESQMKEIQGLLTMTEDNSRRLTTELTTAETLIAQKSAALQAAQQSLTGTTADLERAQRTIYEKEAKVKEMEDVMRQSQAYSATLQSYNTSLQSDLQHEKARRDEASRERDLLQGKAAELGGLCKSLEQQLEYERDQVSKLREGREVLARDVALLRTDLDSTRQERDRLLVENTQSKAEVERIRTAGGRSLETLEALSNDKATMELQLSTQQRLLGEMRQELALAKEHRALAESQAGTRGTQISEMQAQLQEMQQALAKAETRVLQGEVVRRKLHNIIQVGEILHVSLLSSGYGHLVALLHAQELKGNIRVFCRVRPVSSAEQSSSEHDSSMAVEFGANTEVLGAGISLQVPTRGSGDAPAAPAKHSFTFDKVFGPASTQAEVFEEISELVQSALDGHKVCIFAYGQTGSGKTHTMLGTAANPGMIPLAMHQ
ncbi:kinesin-like protein, partial [Haematococcus lacustris]